MRFGGPPGDHRAVVRPAARWASTASTPTTCCCCSTTCTSWRRHLPGPLLAP